jgi:hypothetical protein
MDHTSTQEKFSVASYEDNCMPKGPVNSQMGMIDASQSRQEKRTKISHSVATKVRKIIFFEFVRCNVSVQVRWVAK